MMGRETFRSNSRMLKKLVSFVLALKGPQGEAERESLGFGGCGLTVELFEHSVRPYS